MITGTTPGAIKLRAHRAYVTLRKMLAKKGQRGRRGARKGSRHDAQGLDDRALPPGRVAAPAAGARVAARGRRMKPVRTRTRFGAFRWPRWRGSIAPALCSLICLAARSRRSAARLGDRRGGVLVRSVRDVAGGGARPAARETCCRRPVGRRASRRPRCWRLFTFVLAARSSRPASACGPRRACRSLLSCVRCSSFVLPIAAPSCSPGSSCCAGCCRWARGASASRSARPAAPWAASCCTSLPVRRDGARRARPRRRCVLAAAAGAALLPALLRR